MTIDSTLWTVARCPFLPADDLALFTGTGPRAARAHLLRLHRAGVVDCIHVPETHLRLYYLTPAGIAAAARAAVTSPATLAARYGLGDHALQRRLPNLERLLAGRRVLIALHRALRARGGRLEEWRAWPVSWPYIQGTQRRVLALDGDGTIHLPGSHPDRQPFGFLWDGDGALPAAVLAERLAGLDRLAASATYNGPGAAYLPPVLLVTAAPERVPPGYRPGLLWTTWAEIARRGVLAAPWRTSSPCGDAHSLPAALAALGTRPAPSRRGLALSHAAHPPARDVPGRVGPPPRLQQRVEALRRGTIRDGSLSLLALAIPPRGIAILEALGAHPLLSAPEVAIACALNAGHTWDMLGLLRRRGLIAAWMLPGDRRVRRHVVTARAVRLLAARAGVAPDAYRRLYGTLDHTARTKRRALWFACRNLKHTDGINRAYLALLAAARASGGPLWWRGEWACAVRYPDGPRRGVLRPDAEAVYAGPGGGHHLFVELDRGTMRLRRLRAKLARYGAYRVGTGQDQVTILLVTTGDARGWEALHINETLPQTERMRPLDLLVTTSGEVAGRGAQAHLWRSTSGPCTTLASYLGATASAAYPTT